MKLLALDVGDRRIGVAVCDELGLTVTPLATIRRASKAKDLQRIAHLVGEHDVRGIVVGHPLNRDGSAGAQARRVERYAAALQAALYAAGTPLPVTLWDEYLSTVQAEEVLAASGRRSRARRAGLDAVAAAVILQEYLDAQRSAEMGLDEEATL
jgi:putative Holliday junction resolvase